MTTQTEARELAQRFGVRMCDENGNTHGEELYCLGLDDIIALKEALAQPEQKPVAWRHKGQPWEFKTDYCINLPNVVPDSWEPLYTTPPQRTWVGLTDEEMEEVRKQAVDLFVQEVKTTGKGRNEPIKFGRLVEAKLKEKNT